MFLLGMAAVVAPAISQGTGARAVDPLHEGSGQHQNGFQSVVAISPTSGFFAGGFGSLHRTRLKRWDGHSWFNASGVARPHSRLTAIDALGSDDAWAVGFQGERDGAGTRSLLLHWDGSSWLVSHDGGLGHFFATELEDVAMAAADDVWAVGFDLSQGGTVIKPVILQWDGSLWQLVEAPVDAIFTEVTALAPDEVWLGGTARPSFDWITVRWDGNDWSTEPAAGPIWAMAAVSPDDVWAVGTDTNSPPTGVIQHWDGNAWTVVPSPQPGGNYGTFLTGVSAVSSDDVWAVGETGGHTSGYGETLIEHWDGTEWSVVPSPSPGEWNYLADISADSGDDAWATGTFSNRSSQGPAKILLMHWDGATWKQQHHLQ
jgi:hypothetical protein